MKINRLFLCAFLFILFTATANAATFTVNSTDDEIDINLGDGVCAAFGGKCTLRAAVMEANTQPDADTIILPAGTFKLDRKGANEQLAEFGDLDLAGPVTINGASRSGTIIDGLFLDRIFEITVPFPLTVTNLTIQNGNVTSAGGAIFNQHNKLITVTNVAFLQNRGDAGGAIYTIGPVAVTNSLFDGNSASTGGGVYSSYSSLETSTFVDTTFKNGLAGSFHSLYLSGDLSVKLSNVTVMDNSAQSTGGIYIDTSTGSLTVENSSFSNNSSQSLGVIYYSGEGNISVKGAAFTNNHLTSGGVGAAMHLSVSGTSNLDLSDIVFEENESAGGSADLYYSNSGSGNATLKNITSTDSYCASGGPSCSLYLEGSGSGAAAIESVNVDGAYISSAGAAALYVTGYNSISVKKSNFTNNTLFSGTAAGLYLDGTSIVMEDCLVAGNKIVDGGATAGAFLTGSGSIAFRRTSVIDNWAIYSGAASAGLYLDGGPSTIENSTFSNNFGFLSGALYTSSSVAIKNSTFYQNEALTSASSVLGDAAVHFSNSVVAGDSDVDHCFGAGPFVSDGYNIESSNTCNFASSGDSVFTDPKLSPLRLTPESPLMVHVPLEGSPVLESGDNATCLSEDQRGVARPFDGDQNGGAICDKGAVEFNDFCPSDDKKQFPGICGCGTPDADSDNDGILDCNDGCSQDASKTSPGQCGCGVPDTDALFPANGIADCLEGLEIKTAGAQLIVEVQKLKKVSRKTKKKKRKVIIKARKAAKALLNDLVSFADSSTGVSVASPDLSLSSLTSQMNKQVKKAFNLNRLSNKKKKNALSAIQSLIDGVVS